MNISTTIGELAAALSKAQGAMRNAIKDSNNPFFKSKYADLASVTDACRAELSANGLAVVQLPTVRDGKMVLEYILLHASGEFIGSELEMTPVKSDPQGIGSAITYARRYTLAGIAGVATEDDDGNAASQADAKKHVSRTTEDVPLPPPPRPAAKPSVAEVASEAEASLSPKEGAVPDGCIELGRQVNFAKAFKDALPPAMRKNADEIRREWLQKQGIVDSHGVGTSRAIKIENFAEVREAAVAYAASYQL